MKQTWYVGGMVPFYVYSFTPLQGFAVWETNVGKTIHAARLGFRLAEQFLLDIGFKI
jgi:hypothetical protein